ncbi:MAG: tetratricopeptide repeat protein [Gammaproteobacteria bacterium]
MAKVQYLLRALLAACLALAIAGPAMAQGKKKDDAPPPTGIDAATGKILTEAIEALNKENYGGARAAISKLKMDTLSPYERSRTEQILATIESSSDNYGKARGHLQAAIQAGGLNEKEIQDTRYQIAQMWLAEEKWREGAAALEEWFRTAQSPNGAAYYLLAVAYYQQEDYKRALVPAQKAVDLTDKPQEGWIQLVLALYLQQDRYAEAVPLLKRLLAMSPDKKTYWQQLSSVYGQTEDYMKALGVMQIAYNAGILTDDSDIRRLADLQLYNELPYRCGLTLEDAISKKLVKADAKLYEKHANCWISARDFGKAIGPLARAAELAGNGDLYVRLGEVQIQRNEWAEAAAALQNGLRKGGLKDTGNAQLLLGIANFNQKKFGPASEAFNRARNFDKHRKMADGYLQLIRVQQG